MKMKKFIAPTMAQAMEKVRLELGSDAVIFHTKKVKSGRFFNLFKKENVEVLAASDAEVDVSFNKKRKRTEEIDKEPSLPGRSLQSPGLPFRRSRDRVDRVFSAPAFIDTWYERLADQGLLREDIDPLIQTLVKKWYQSDEQMSSDDMLHVLRDGLVQAVDPARFQEHALRDHYVMLVGPTGVGKTTTLAKLAGRTMLDEGKKIAFITSDTYRIAAIDQLRMYANILDAPFEVAYTKQDFQALMNKFADYDHVFIDTAGRNFQNSAYINELITMIGNDGAQIGLYLVLAATSKFEDMDRIIHQFESLHLKRMILSKIDETMSYGAMISILLRHRQLSVSYITNGQDVPDDLKSPNIRELINLLLGGSYGEGSG